MNKILGRSLMIGVSLLAAITASASTLASMLPADKRTVINGSVADSSLFRIDSVDRFLPGADSTKFTTGEGRGWTVRGYKSRAQVYTVSNDSSGVLSYTFPIDQIASSNGEHPAAAKINNLSVAASVIGFDADIPLSTPIPTQISFSDLAGHSVFSTETSMLRSGRNYVGLNVPKTVASGTYIMKVITGTDVQTAVVTYVKQ